LANVHILLLEDDPQLGRALSHSLEAAGLAVNWVRTVAEADRFLDSGPYTIVLLDLGLPDGSGLEVLKAMRRRDDRSPVLILTARDAIEDRIRGLDAGADDYLSKPFAVPEMLARVRALVRRSSGFAAQCWQIGDLLLDTEAHSLEQAGAPVNLSPREFQVLLHLARRAGRVVTRAQLEEAIFDLGEGPESNAIEVHIHHLRRKLGSERIRTIRGLGYLLEAQ